MPYIPENEQPKYFYLNGKPGPDYCLVIDAIVDKFTGFIVYSDGTKDWFINGKRHRLDGPAIEYSDGSKEWWVDGKYITEEQHKLLCDIMRLKGLM